MLFVAALPTELQDRPCSHRHRPCPLCTADKSLATHNPVKGGLSAQDAATSSVLQPVSYWIIMDVSGMIGFSVAYMLTLRSHAVQSRAAYESSRSTPCWATAVEHGLCITGVELVGR